MHVTLHDKIDLVDVIKFTDIEKGIILVYLDGLNLITESLKIENVSQLRQREM